MARRKREEGESPFWREYAREDDMKVKKPRSLGRMRSVRPHSYKPRKKSYRRRGRR